MSAFASPRVQRRRDSVAVLGSYVLPLAVAACLALDAFVHLHDASAYGAVRTSVLSQADLFRIQAGLAILVALMLLARPRWQVWAAAFVLLAGAAAAVTLYTYVDVGQIGPVPDMYEPTWALPGKLASAWAEGIGAVLALVGLALSLRRGIGVRRGRGVRREASR